MGADTLLGTPAEECDSAMPMMMTDDCYKVSDLLLEGTLIGTCAPDCDAKVEKGNFLNTPIEG